MAGRKKTKNDTLTATGSDTQTTHYAVQVSEDEIISVEANSAADAANKAKGKQS